MHLRDDLSARDAQTVGGHPPDSVYRQPNGSRPTESIEPMVLPPGTSRTQFREYCERAAEIVGDENVTIISNPSELDGYGYLKPSKASDMFNIMDDDYFLCSAVVSPRGVEDVQALMNLANAFEIPV